MKTLVFTLLMVGSMAASAACPGYLWECRDKTIDPPVPAGPVEIRDSWWHCDQHGCFFEHD